MNLKEHLLAEIKRIESQLEAQSAPLLSELERYKATLAAFEGHRKSGPKEDRFVAMTPRRAIFMLLREHGRARSQADLTQELVDGGITRGKKRDLKQPNNVRISFERLLGNETLVQKNGLIGLPEWGNDKFEPADGGRG